MKLRNTTNVVKSRTKVLPTMHKYRQKGAWDLAGKSEEGEPGEWTGKQGEPITERFVHGVPPTPGKSKSGHQRVIFHEGITDIRVRARGATLRTPADLTHASVQQNRKRLRGSHVVVCGSRMRRRPAREFRRHGSTLIPNYTKQRHKRINL
jgi:hypothetical protein